MLLFPLLLSLAVLHPALSEQCGTHLNDSRSPVDQLHHPSNFAPLDTRLIGGIETEPHTWPWVAQLMLNGRHRCGGALIEPDIVLTAAHCFARSKDPSLYTVYLGGHYSGTGTEHRVRNISVHSLFNVIWANAYDVALIRIDRPANLSDTTRTICLPTLPVPMNHICVVAGWGVMNEREKEGSDKLHEIHIPVIPWWDCANLDMFRGRVHIPSMICAGYIQGSLDSCQGDSGGPLMCAQNGKWEVQGIVSWGIGCGRPGLPGVYSSVHSALPWIYTELWKLKNL